VNKTNDVRQTHAISMPAGSIKLGTLNHIRLTVTNIPRSKEFYDRILPSLGYMLVEESDTRIAWAGPTISGNLQWFIISVANPNSVNKVHDRYSPGLHHLALNADCREEVDRLHQLLLEIGATVLDPPAEYDYEPGYYAVFFSDPDGMKLEVVHVPQWGSAEYWEKALERAKERRSA